MRTTTNPATASPQGSPIPTNEVKTLMNPAQFATAMKRIAANRDTEVAHGEADDLMSSLLDVLGYGEGVEIFREMEKWYA